MRLLKGDAEQFLNINHKAIKAIQIEWHWREGSEVKSSRLKKERGQEGLI